MAPLIRAARREEQRTIRTIVRRARLYPLDLRWQHFWVAEENGEIVGVGQVRPHDDGSRELASIAVLPSHGGRGIGGRLVRALLAQEPGPLYLMCAQEMEPFYTRFGFQRIATGDAPPSLRWKVRIGEVFSALITRLTGEPVGVIVMRIERVSHSRDTPAGGRPQSGIDYVQCTDRVVSGG